MSDTSGLFFPTQVMRRVLDGTWVAATPGDDGDATDAALMMVPTSIAYTGTSATTTASGSVEFTACTSVSLNGVFTGDFDNYQIVIRGTSSANDYMEARLRASGVDEDASWNYYTRQYIYADSTSIAGAISQQNEFRIGNFSNVQRWGAVTDAYGPYLAQPTAFRSVAVSDYASAYIEDYASTHSLSNSYDGITLLSRGTQTHSGVVSVYGIRGA